MIKYRNHTLDIAKGLGIILVVFGHNWLVLHEKGELFRVVFSFHLPLFFFLSGVFLRESGSFREFAASRMHSLLKPYFVILLLLAVFKLSHEAIQSRQLPADALGYLGGIFYATGRTIDWIPLWFLPHLFIASCAAFLVIKCIVSNPVRWIMLCVALGLGVLLLNPRDLPWSVDLLPISISFLLLGYMCRNFVKVLAVNGFHLVLALVLFAALHYFFDETIDLNLRLYGNFMVATLQALSGIYISLALSCWLAKYQLASKVLGYIGSGTLFILLFHVFFQDKVFKLLIARMDEPWLAVLCSLLAGVLLPLILWEFVKRSSYLTAVLLPRKPTLAGVSGEPLQAQ